MICRDVAALYVDPKGPYPHLVRHWWDEKADAKDYEGPWPVVAHPPCGPWSKMRGLCTKQDPSCGPRALEQVRRWGGVLEHPEHSTLLRGADATIGRIYTVRQVSWGHACDKPTWLYVVGVPHHIVEQGIRTGGKATHRVTSGPRGPKLPSLNKAKVHLTPWTFAAWLISLATYAQVPR